MKEGSVLTIPGRDMVFVQTSVRGAEEKVIYV